MNPKGMKCLLAALFISACTENELLMRERETFAVQFSATGISAEINTRALLADDVTLRILAFRRLSITPDLSMDEYMGTGVYKANGGDGTLTTVTPLLLRAGTYDFYALTPDQDVIYPDNTGDGLTCTVSVGHGMDYATSLTTQKTVSEAMPTVVLDELCRHCTKLGFALMPQNDNIRSIEIISAGLTNMTGAPLRGQLCEELPVGAAGRTTPLEVTDFMAPDATRPLELFASAIVLPRKPDAFDYRMKVKFNGSMQETELSARLPADLTLQPGYSYTFTVKLKGGVADLVLTVRPWNDDIPFNTEMGGEAEGNVVVLTVGTWDDVHWDSTTGNPADTGGGNTHLVVTDWQPNESWTTEMG